MLAFIPFNEQRQRIKSPEYNHMICIGKTKCTSEKGLLGQKATGEGTSIVVLLLITRGIVIYM